MFHNHNHNKNKYRKILLKHGRNQLNMSVVVDEIQSKSIKEIYKLAEDKKELVELLANKYDRTPRSISNNWFSGFFSVPKKLKDQVKEDMVCYVTTGKLSETEND